VLDDVVKELPTWYVLSDEVELPGCLDDLVELNDIWMTCQFKNFNLPCHSLHINLFNNFVFFQDFNSYFFSSQVVSSKPYFPESALADGLSY
jgi:hypothetical protein